MATTQLLSLVISAIDKATAPIKGIQGALSGLSRSAKEASSVSSGLSSAIASGMLQAQAAIAITQQGFGALQGAIAKSTDLQISNLTTAQTFSALTGTAFDESAKFVDRLNSSLAISAAALPGTTEDYTRLARSISDNVLPAFQDASGKMKNLAGFEGSLKSITESFGVLSAASGVDIGNTSLGLTKALGGASVAELRLISVFEQNPQILNAIDKRLKEVGAKSLRDLDVQSRIALIQTIGEKFVTGEFKARASETVDGLLQSFKSTLFDPSTGVFGLSKDLNLNQAGQQSAFASFNKLLKSVIGNGGLTERLRELLEGLGLSANPMVLLRDGFEFLNTWVLNVTKGLQFIKDRIPKGGDFFSKIEKLMGNIDLSLVNVGKFLQDNLGGIGKLLAGYINDAIAAIPAVLSAIDWGWVSESLMGATTFFFNEFGSFLMNLDASVYASAAGVLLGASIIGGVGSIAAGLGAAIIAATAGLPVLLTGAIVLGVVAAAQIITDNWSVIWSAIAETLQSMGRVISGIIKSVVGLLTGNGGLIVKGFDDIFKGTIDIIRKVLDSIAIARQTLGDNTALTSGQTAANNAAALADQKLAQAIKNNGGSAIVPSRFMGQIPTAASGLMSALALESSRAPRNSTPVIANSSEFILRPEQMRNLVQGTAAIASSGGSSFAPTINISGSFGDVESLSKEVLRHLEIFYQEFQQGQLA